jgi:sugar-specific transcriptional regulator TrmB
LSVDFVSAKVGRELKEIGLTEYECMAYLALVKYGELTAGQVSENTSIPYSKVYTVLDSLEKKGWIEIKSGRPRLFYPKSPVEALRAEKLRQENKFEKSRGLIIDEVQALYEQREIKEKPEIWIVRGEENILSKIKETMSNVKHELMVAIPVISPKLFQQLFPNIEMMRDTKVEIKLLTTDEAIASLPQQFFSLAEIKVRDDLFGGGLVADGQISLLFLSGNKGGEENIAIWSDHVGLTMIAKIYFEHLWETAKSYVHP